MENPLVSIVIVTMNHEKFIEQACQSAVDQTYGNKEIIFLDNDSEDNTFEKGKKVLENSSIPSKIIKNTERFNVSKNLNILVSNASGKYISILSGDDWWKENLIEEKVGYISKNDCDFILSDGYKYIQETGETVDAYAEKDKLQLVRNLKRFFHWNVVQNRSVNVGTFVKAELLKNYPFDENVNTEDWDMNLRLTCLGYKAGFIDKKLFYYRILKNSLSRNWKVMQNSYQQVTSKYEDYIKADKNLTKEYLLNLLKFKYGIQLTESNSEKEKNQILKSWKREKYRIKYKQPVLFFKLLLLK